MPTDPTACRMVDRERVVLAYLAGTLPPDEAEAFESHCMSCEECALEIERGVEVRAALAPASTAPRAVDVPPAPVAHRFEWRWLAAAASVVFVVSIWRLNGPQLVQTPEPTPTREIDAVQSPPPAPPVTPAPVPSSRTTPAKSPEPALVYRKPSAAGLKLEAAREPGGDLRLTWTAIDKAARYVITVHASDGTSLVNRETTAATIAIPAAEIAVKPGLRLRARVEARSALGVPLATSALLELPVR